MPSWLPNAISAFRVLLIPVWVLVGEHHRDALLSGESHRRFGLLAVLLVLGFSDVLDGWLARRYGLTTQLGAVLDAVADKLAQLTMTTYLTFRAVPEQFPLPIALWTLLLAREAIMATGWLTLRHLRGHVISSHLWHGKAASTLLFATVFSVLAGLPWPLCQALVWITAALILLSTADYVRVGVVQLRAPSEAEG